ncbi:LysR family transcriptional regulator [Bacillus sp. BGMRC 2118]|nr:LysR family transcriptional regulator [Bacillus sp. BGMRC 2118]
MNMIQLQYLIDVGELGSFTEAAKKNHMTVPAISISISQLEQELGTSLFIRTRRGVTPTVIGKTVIQHAVSILGKIDKMKEDISTYENKSHENFMIATTPGMVQSIINTTLSYQKHSPHMNLQLLEGDTTFVLKHVKSGHADIGFVSLSKDNHDASLTWDPIIQDPPILVVNKHSPLTVKKSISSNEIKNETIVLYNDPVIKMAAEKLVLDDPTNTIALISNNVESLFQMVIRGNAISIATEFIVNSLPPHIKDEIMMIPIEEFESDSYYIWRVTRKDQEKWNLIEQFTEHLLG